MRSAARRAGRAPALGAHCRGAGRSWLRVRGGGQVRMFAGSYRGCRPVRVPASAAAHHVKKPRSVPTDGHPTISGAPTMPPGERGADGREAAGAGSPGLARRPIVTHSAGEHPANNSAYRSPRGRARAPGYPASALGVTHIPKRGAEKPGHRARHFEGSPALGRARWCLDIRVSETE